MTTEQKGGWVLEGCKWIAAAVVAQWLSLDESYRVLGIMLGIELFVGSALTIRRNGLAKWCNYYAGWSIISKVVICFIIFGTVLMSNALGNHMAEPISLAPWVALSFSIQQFITVIKKSRGLDVDPPPLVDAIMARAEKWLKVSADLVIEQDQVSPSKTITTVKLSGSEPLVIPSSDIPQK